MENNEENKKIEEFLEKHENSLNTFLASTPKDLITHDSFSKISKSFYTKNNALFNKDVIDFDELNLLNQKTGELISESEKKFFEEIEKEKGTKELELTIEEPSKKEIIQNADDDLDLELNDAATTINDKKALRIALDGYIEYKKNMAKIADTYNSKKESINIQIGDYSDYHPLSTQLKRQYTYKKLKSIESKKEFDDNIKNLNTSFNKLSNVEEVKTNLKAYMTDSFPFDDPLPVDSLNENKKCIDDFKKASEEKVAFVSLDSARSKHKNTKTAGAIILILGIIFHVITFIAFMASVYSGNDSDEGAMMALGVLFLVGLVVFAVTLIVGIVLMVKAKRAYNRAVAREKAARDQAFKKYSKKCEIFDKLLLSYLSTLLKIEQDFKDKKLEELHNEYDDEVMNEEIEMKKEMNKYMAKKHHMPNHIFTMVESLEPIELDYFFEISKSAETEKDLISYYDMCKNRELARKNNESQMRAEAYQKEQAEQSKIAAEQSKIAAEYQREQAIKAAEAADYAKRQMEYQQEQARIARDQAEKDDDFRKEMRRKMDNY